MNASKINHRFRRGTVTPCPSCRGRKHDITGGEGFLPPGYVLAVTCRKCESAGHIIVDVETAKQLYQRSSSAIQWLDTEISPRR